jgi:protein O-GlcNAc transferase
MSDGTPSIPQALEAAMARHRAGDLGGAASAYDAVLAREPANFDALHLRGTIALQTGDLARAVEWLTRAVAVHPDAYPAIVQLAAALGAAGRADAAESSFRRAIAVAPDYVPAREAYALALNGQRRFAESAQQFAEIARLQPDSFAAHNNLGAMLWQLERRADALAAWERALVIEPRHPDALFNSAQALERVGRPLEAVERMRGLLDQRPAHAPIYYQAGLLFHAQGLREDALRAFADALVRDPDHVESRWMQAIAQLRLAYGPHEDPAGDIARFERAVQELDTWFVGPRTALADRALGTRGPFYIAYHDADIRAPLSRYGDLCARLMRECHGPLPAPSRRTNVGGPARVAVVSAYFRDHSVWTALTRGWCMRVDPARVELHLVHTGSVSDGETALAREHAASFLTGLHGMPAWIAAIRELAPDVIVYPDACMDPVSVGLASLRLAPVQVASWGHPQTSGLPTVDYFLSAAAFEPPDGAAHYRERLIALPNLGCYYDPLTPGDLADGAYPALPVSDGPRLLCVGTPYKYLPQHDERLVDIAERLGACQFLFFVDDAQLLSRKVEDRIALAFAARGLEAAQFVRFLPRLTRPAFFSLMRGADVYLDTIGFSGFNTAMQAVECGLPVVTYEGRFMRGRLATGILRQIGLDDLVATDPAGYVEIAARVAGDPGYRADVRRRMAQRQSALFRDLAPVRALEDFLVRVAQGR